jgi:hypothetical protein
LTLDKGGLTLDKGGFTLDKGVLTLDKVSAHMIQSVDTG